MDKNKAQNRTRDLPEEESYETIYRSKLLNKEFTSLEELRDAEYAFNKAHEAELKEKAEKKEMAEAIEVAFKEYCQVCNAADKRIKEVSQEENEKILKAKKVYLALRDDFVNKYGAYHMTYTNNNGKELVSINDIFETMFKGFPRLW